MDIFPTVNLHKIARFLSQKLFAKVLSLQSHFCQKFSDFPTGIFCKNWQLFVLEIFYQSSKAIVLLFHPKFSDFSN